VTIDELLAVCEKFKTVPPNKYAFVNCQTQEYEFRWSAEQHFESALRCLSSCFALIDNHHFLDGTSLTGDEMAAKLRNIKERFEAGE